MGRIVPAVLQSEPPGFLKGLWPYGQRPIAAAKTRRWGPGALVPARWALGTRTHAARKPVEWRCGSPGLHRLPDLAFNRAAIGPPS